MNSIPTNQKARGCWHDGMYLCSFVTRHDYECCYLSYQPSLPPSPKPNLICESKVSYSRTKCILTPVSWSSTRFQIFYQEDNLTCKVFLNCGNFLPAHLCSIQFWFHSTLQKYVFDCLKMSWRNVQTICSSTEPFLITYVYNSQNLNKKVENSHFL